MNASIDGLKYRCGQSLSDIVAEYPHNVIRYQYPGEERMADNLGDGLTSIYIDNGSPVLGVCHLDYVEIKYHFAVADLSGTTVFCPRLDDRLGVYLLLDVVPYLVTHPYDILLTTGEETGHSSAVHFKTDKAYDWIFELDRRGLDAVTYHAESKEWRSALGAHNWSIGYGSYSDISSLKTTQPCCMVNFGIGYHDEHTRVCHAFISDIEKSVRRVASFYNANFGLSYEADPYRYQPKKYQYQYDYSSRWQYGDRWNNRTTLDEPLALPEPDETDNDDDAIERFIDYETNGYGRCDVCRVLFASNDLCLFNGSVLCDDCYYFLYDESVK